LTTNAIWPLRSETAAHNGPYDPRGKTSEQIENEIAETRAELSNALRMLQDKFTPPQVLEQGMNMLHQAVTRKSVTSPNGLADGLFPAAVIGIGILLFARSLSQEKMRPGPKLSAPGEHGSASSGDR
jgi:hypothetical protein